MLAMFLCRKHTSAAYSAIGHYFGGLNHSSVVAAEKKLRRWIEENSPLAIGESRPPVREVVELVERELSR
jgi:chromosomal replication initiator protein